MTPEQQKAKELIEIYGKEKALKWCSDMVISATFAPSLNPIGTKNAIDFLESVRTEIINYKN